MAESFGIVSQERHTKQAMKNTVRRLWMRDGAVIHAVMVVSAVRERKAQTQAKEQREASGRTGCAPSAQDEERELCFLTDLGTAKDGHRMEDR